MADNLDNVSKAEQEIEQQTQQTNQDQDTPAAETQQENTPTNEENNDESNANSNEIQEDNTPQPTQDEATLEPGNGVSVSDETPTISENNEQNSPGASVTGDSNEEIVNQVNGEHPNVQPEEAKTTENNEQNSPGASITGDSNEEIVNQVNEEQPNVQPEEAKTTENKEQNSPGASVTGDSNEEIVNQVNQEQPNVRPEEAETTENIQKQAESIDKVDEPNTKPDQESTATESNQQSNEENSDPNTPKDTAITIEEIPYMSPDLGEITQKYGNIPRDELPQYVPPENNPEVMNLDKLMGAIESGETELESTAEPPTLFARPELQENYKKISELKTKLIDEEFEPYVDNFEREVQDDVLMIGKVSLEEIQEEEMRLKAEHIEYQQQQATMQKKLQEEILLKEEGAKKNVVKYIKEKQKSVRKREAANLQMNRIQQDHLHKSFKRAENQLMTALERRKGEVKTLYGDLIMADNAYGGSKGRRWKVDWDKTPQPIQVKVKCVRAIKDKLPVGRYVVMVSMYDRLGGHVLRWSNLKGQQWGGATLPVSHDGNFFNVDMKFNQSVFTVCPSKPDVRPGMILVFELFILRGEVTPVDRVVGWGCFPICDAKFNIIEGRYKCPLIRGDVDPSIDKHTKIEALLTHDIDYWLGNIYFEVIKLPRYLAGQKEYEVELQFSSNMIAFPDRTRVVEETKDGEKPVFGSRVNLQTDGESRRDSLISAISTGSDSKDNKNDQADEKRVGKIGKSGFQTDPTSVVMSRKLLEGTASEKDDDSDDESDIDETFMQNKDEDFQPIPGEPGLYYKRHLNNPIDVYARKYYTMLPKTQILRTMQKRKLTYQEELEQHTMAVQTPFSNKARPDQDSNEKMDYVGRQFLAELGLSQWRSREFWVMFVMFILVFFARMYAHYIGQYVYIITWLSIFPSRFEFKPYTVTLTYQDSLLHTRQEMLVVLFGPGTDIVIFILLVISSWASQRIFGSFPSLGSKFTIAFGIETILDPLLILIVDCATGRFSSKIEQIGGNYVNGTLIGSKSVVTPVGDAFKLYNHFLNLQQSGAVGILLTSFLYIFTIFIGCAILYMYFLRLHNNGRMLDVYQRLHGGPGDFFIPHDLEISNEELNFICRKAEKWRGEEGERRKVAVYDYVWEEEQMEENEWGEVIESTDKGKRETTTHLSIHSLHLDGLRELYRHFLRLPDGAIVEVFGDMGIVGMDDKVRQAIQRGAQDVENLLGSQPNIRQSQASLRSRKSRPPSRVSLRSQTGDNTSMKDIPPV
ncbi:uncharacterized protein TRIADDRAFT_58934 [Trichoplax adhaerens]|uniref:Uncharacterized protein n=1 Tax=Trichoplax adhaerens TaxID=10228 RepID=B3S430_TRIAD|nr:hypothetical protein TRIADDRAFT_58934 [Trichoplax adhaerens]EDV22569.1 hypothetical protein TRIADDRAFT_58934 [Trichoplax adhaerens]|eukprot:XP_002115113.1 hypothetical protein TRIADDRAFT_58934 [Trichoplax adhaerens]